MQCDKAIAKAALACFQFDKDFDIEIRLVYSPPCSLFTFLNLKCFPILCLVDETRNERVVLRHHLFARNRNGFLTAVLYLSSRIEDF